MKLSHRLYSHLFGSSFLEVYRLDSMLESFIDTRERDYDWILRDKNQDVFRIINRLLKDGYLEKDGNAVRITSEGLVFLSEGGYTHHFIETKRSGASFWISLISIALAVASFIISIRNT